MTPPQPLPPQPGAHPGAPGNPGAHGSPGAPYGATLPPGALPQPGAVPPPPPAGPPSAPQGFPDLTEGLAVCPICRSPQTGRFCEECGYDYDLSAPQRAPQPFPAAPAPPPAPAPLNIPAAYGGAPQAPAAPHPDQQHGQHPGHHQGQHPGQGLHPNPYPGPFAGQQHGGHPGEAPALPPQPAVPSGYGYPPPVPAQQAPAPAPVEPPVPTQPNPRPDGPYGAPQPREDSGPVYAQPGPARRGDEFGTSFHLAPPAPPQGPPAEPVRTTWFAVIAADREYFTDMMARSGPEAAGLFFPPYCPERRIPLTGRGQLRIGRRSQHRGTVPEIDLSVAPEDPGASHQHALLAEQPDGGWVLVDQDSTNGTTVNGGAEPIAPHTAIPLNDGDRIHIGAWTTITVHRA
ncbi:FHA domain-containing protein [Kitasatospora sp. NPDC004723]|uniref:FHA domain-containing protein n=1 Tax=Kitasatospora sp. NPDC004723 TaxID=3154288 RepID=UPI00339FC0FC